jgi:uncharacterized membrane protein YraQ (UPF0718 family)
MSEAVEKYLSEKEAELSVKQKVKRNEHLLALGLCEREYAPDQIDDNGNISNLPSKEYPFFDPDLKRAYRRVAAEISDEEYQRVCELEEALKQETVIVPAREREASNSIAKSLSAVGWFFIIGGIIAGFIAGITSETVVSYFSQRETFEWSVAITYWVVSFVSGILMLGVAEIIDLLERINSKLR